MMGRWAFRDLDETCSVWWWVRVVRLAVLE